MALDAVSVTKRLPLVRLDQICGSRVVAVHAQRRGGLGQVIIELNFALLPDFMRHMAGGTSHVKGGMAAAILGNIQSLCMASEAKILIFLAGVGLNKKIFVVGSVRTVALDAVANRWRMDRTLQLSSVLVGVAGQA